MRDSTYAIGKTLVCMPKAKCHQESKGHAVKCPKYYMYSHTGNVCVGAQVGETKLGNSAHISYM